MARARRSAEAAEAMRRQLIRAAREMIAARGLGAVTARALAAQLGWSVGAIYTVAPSIDAVTLEANAEELADLKQAFEARKQALETAEASAEDTIRAFAEIYLRFATARPKSWAAIFERDAEGEPPEWYRARQTSLFALIEQAARPLTRDGEEARRAARALWAALHGLLALSLAGHLQRVSSGAPQSDLAALEDHASDLIDVYLSGLRARRGAPAR